MSVTDVTGRFPTPLKWPRLAMDLSRVDAIVIHHTAVDPRTGEPGLLFPAAQMTVEDELNHIAVIHLYHKSKGFGGFGYHLIVFPSGRAYLVTPLTQWGAHVGDENDHLWGIAFAGDFTSRLPGAAQVKGARNCVQFCFEFIGEELPIRPHKAYGGTSCPGRLVEILEQLKEDDMDEKIEQRIEHLEKRKIYLAHVARVVAAATLLADKGSVDTAVVQMDRVEECLESLQHDLDSGRCRP